MAPLPQVRLYSGLHPCHMPSACLPSLTGPWPLHVQAGEHGQHCRFCGFANYVSCPSTQSELVVTVVLTAPSCPTICDDAGHTCAREGERGRGVPREGAEA